MKKAEEQTVVATIDIKEEDTRMLLMVLERFIDSTAATISSIEATLVEMEAERDGYRESYQHARSLHKQLLQMVEGVTDDDEE